MKGLTKIKVPEDHEGHSTALLAACSFMLLGVLSHCVKVQPPCRKDHLEML